MRVSSKTQSQAAGFTLIEVLTSTALLVLIMVLVMTTVEQTQKVWSRAATKVTQFQSARNAFDSMTRRMAQATLNTYYRAIDENTLAEKAAFNYARESELQFISGPMATIVSQPPLDGLPEDVDHSYPTHGVFFQAPLGLTVAPEQNDPNLPLLRGLSNTLVGTGYFIEHADDANVPKPLQKEGLLRPKNRYRLMQLDMPTELLTIYDRPLDAQEPNKYRNIPQVINSSKMNYIGMIDRTSKPTGNWLRPMWMQTALYRSTKGESSGYNFENARVLADNVIALIVLPKLPQRDRIAVDRLDQLAPYYMYDSWRILSDDSSNPFKSPRHNQLPPILQVTMIAMDEPSGARVADRYKAELPKWWDELFTQADTEVQFREELARLERRIIEDPARINHRVFTTDVVIRGSKWSRDANFFIK